MQSKGGTSNFACLERWLEVEWPGSVESFVWVCKPVK